MCSSDLFGLPVKHPVEKAAAVIYGTEGFVVCPNYESGVAFDYDGHELGTWDGGRYQQHFANFVKAVRSRRHEDLHLDIEDGHLSSALAHLGNVSWSLGEAVPQVVRRCPLVHPRANTKPSNSATAAVATWARASAAP